MKLTTLQNKNLQKNEESSSKTRRNNEEDDEFPINSPRKRRKLRENARKSEKMQWRKTVMDRN